MLWNAKNGTVPLGDTEMDYVSFGHGDRSLVLLPGLSDALATVRGKALLLARPYTPFFEEYTVYMFSRKNKMPPTYTIRDMAWDQAAALEALGIRRSHVLGVSQGGMIAQVLAIDHADLVEKLILAVTAPCVNEQLRSCVNRWIALARQGRHRELMIDTAEKSYSPERLRKLRRLYPLLGALGKPASYDRFLTNAGAILGFDAGDALGRIRCPTLILAGGEDRIVGAQASFALREKIPDSELYVYPHLGHGAYEEAEDFYPRIRAFLAEKQERTRC